MLSGGHRSWSGRGFVEALPGDVITVNPGEMHDGEAIGGESRAWRMVYLRPDLIARAGEEAEAAPFEFAEPAFRDATVRRLFLGLFAATTQRAADPLQIEERLVTLIAELIARHAARPLRSPSAPTGIERALARLDDDPAAKATLAELAAIAGLSRFQLLRVFARRLGVTPHAYLVQRRVQRARELLRAGRTPAEAALEAGFADQSHLTRAFARCYGVTPARFRAAAA